MTLDELRQKCQGIGNQGPEYVAKQLHKIPPAPLVDRKEFILERCKGKVVLDIGASGYMHEAIVEVAKKCYGIDRPGVSDVTGVVGIDLDDDPGRDLPVYDDVEAVVCGEVLEHLSNPGRFLNELAAWYKAPVIITVPHAFSEIARRRLEKDGLENVNIDHVAWYSPRTLKTLLERAGYDIKQWACYNGKWPFSEGIIVIAE